MQVTTILTLFCTIAVVLINVSATSMPQHLENVNIIPLPSQPLTKLSTRVRVRSKRNIAGRSDWTTNITPESAKIFNHYKEQIATRLQMIFNVPTTFVPQPEKITLKPDGGTSYHYLVRVPTNKYAHVQIFYHPDILKRGGLGSGHNLSIQPPLYGLNDVNI